MNRTLWFILFLAGALLSTGCQKSAKSLNPTYDFKWESRLNEVELRATLKSEDISSVSMSNGWGLIDWMGAEGSVVASGDVLVKINMEESLRRKRSLEKRLAGQIDQSSNLNVSGPAEVAELRKTLREKELELQQAIVEEGWLKQKKKPDEIWKIYADVQIASISYQHARNVYELKKGITEKGFDSPFALRISEIDMRSREIELEYADRVKKGLAEPPLLEELARLKYQQAVASSEIWLSQTQLQAASISSQLKSKNFEVVIERINAQIRENNKALDDKELKAPRSGILIHPVVWGDFKFRPGAQAWSGITIVQVIGSDKFYLEAMAAEADANLIVEKASATIEFDARPGKVFAGEVKSMSKSPRASRGQSTSKMRFFPVQISCNLDEKILVGAKAKVTINMGQRSGVFVPREALVKQGEGFALKVRTTFSEALQPVEIEDFNQDWAIWKNAPASQGVILFP